MNLADDSGTVVAFKETGSPAVLECFVLKTMSCLFFLISDVMLASSGYIPFKHHCLREFWLSVLDHRSRS